jgi:hypothetical protein
LAEKQCDLSDTAVLSWYTVSRTSSLVGLRVMRHAVV